MYLTSATLGDVINVLICSSSNSGELALEGGELIVSENVKVSFASKVKRTCLFAGL